MTNEELYLTQYKDTNYYLNKDGEAYRKTPTGKYKRIYGTNERNSDCHRVRINIHGKKYHLARMMWETFKGPIPDGYIIAHKNGCSTMNDLGNLEMVKINNSTRFRARNPRTRKVINLSTKEIYKGGREAEKKLKHTRKCIYEICCGATLPKLKLNIAWWDDINMKAFRGNYIKYYNKYMKGRA